MIYTIASLEDIHGSIIVDIEKNGNKYAVSIYNKGTREITLKKFDTIESAYKVFEQLSKAIVTGCYSYEQRKAFLA